MMTNRRKFVTTAAGAGLAALPFCSPGARAAVPHFTLPALASSAVASRYSRLDEILRQPLLKKELFAKPVIIETVELLRLNNSFLCRVRSRDGAEGISVGHSGMRTLFPIFPENLQPFFIGKDARELDLILEPEIPIPFCFSLMVPAEI